MVVRIFSFFLFLGISLSLCLPVLASKPIIEMQELQSLGFENYESVNPNQLIYPLKTVWEYFMITKANTPEKKAEYSSQLLTSRFNELVYIASFQKTGFLFNTVERYNSLVGTIAASQYNIINPHIKNNARQYHIIIERTRDIYPANSGPWVEIQQAVDTTRSLY